MDTGQARPVSGRMLRWAAGTAGVAAGAYAAYAATTWARFGQPAPPRPDAADPLLDRFMPVYDVAERHHIHVAAPAAITYAASREMDINQSMIARTIFRVREIALGARRDTVTRPRGVVAFTTSIGWGVLAELPGVFAFAWNHPNPLDDSRPIEGGRRTARAPRRLSGRGYRAGSNSSIGLPSGSSI